MLDHRFPGNVPVALAALAGIVVCVLAFGRRVIRAGEFDWRTVLFLATVIGLWIVALSASSVAVAAVPGDLSSGVRDTTPACRTGGDDGGQVRLRWASRSCCTEPIGPICLWRLHLRWSVSIAAPVIGTVIMTSIEQRSKLAALGRGARREPSRECSALPGSRRGGGAGKAGSGDPRHARTGIHQHRRARPGSRARVGDRHRRCETARRADPQHGTGKSRRGAGDGGRADPDRPDEGSLPAAIQRQCDRLSAETGVERTMRVDGELPPLGMATDVVLLRAAQEAFANIRKHSRASTVTVELSRAEGWCPTVRGGQRYWAWR